MSDKPENNDLLADDAKTAVYFTVYVSTALEKFSEPQLLDLLEVSRRNNLASGITGVLLYHDGNFMQALEGPKDAVLTKQRRIFSDPRHHGALTLFNGTSPVREFGEWTMGFVSMNTQEQAELAGFNNFLRNRDENSSDNNVGSRIWKLLKTFRKSVR